MEPGLRLYLARWGSGSLRKLRTRHLRHLRLGAAGGAHVQGPGPARTGAGAAAARPAPQRAAAACAGAAEPPSRGARRRLGAARTRRGFGAEHAPSSRGTQALSLSRIQAWHHALAPRNRRRCACPGPGAGAHRRRSRGGAAGAATHGSGVRRRGGTAEPRRAQAPRCCTNAPRKIRRAAEARRHCRSVAARRGAARSRWRRRRRWWQRRPLAAP
jgi:hypothetical protein